MKIGIVGSRRRSSDIDYKLIADIFDRCVKDSGIGTSIKPYSYGDVQIISGGCGRGADRFAETIASNRGVPITIYWPDWQRFEMSATFVRNGRIAKDSDILIACVAPDRKGGTEDTIAKFKREHPDGELIIV